jgi:hypothetical protein
VKIKDITDVLTFAAFRPEPDDSAAPWIRRFPGRRTLLLNVGKNKTTWRSLGKGGKLLDGGMQKGDFKDLASNLAPEWRKLTDDGWCAVSLNSRYVISLEANLPRKEGIEDIMRANPRAVLGSKFERQKRYALTNNPEHATSIVLSCEDDVVKKIEGGLSEGSLQTGRICCGPYAMLRRAIEYANTGEPLPDGSPRRILYVICCEGAVCLLTQVGDMWTELRSRADFYEEDFAPVLEMARPGRRGPEDMPGEILLVADNVAPELVEGLAGLFPKAKITDLTQPDHLWRMLADLPLK